MCVVLAVLEGLAGLEPTSIQLRCYGLEGRSDTAPILYPIELRALGLLYTEHVLWLKEHGVALIALDGRQCRPVWEMSFPTLTLGAHTFIVARGHYDSLVLLLFLGGFTIPRRSILLIALSKASR